MVFSHVTDLKSQTFEWIILFTFSMIFLENCLERINKWVFKYNQRKYHKFGNIYDKMSQTLSRYNIEAIFSDLKSGKVGKVS